tara:strand:- start:5179 stop:6312 length:1134 start_codon:yes stop_codon:yes gene_type:complete
MQFEKKLDKYFKKRSETFWDFNVLPKNNFYDMFIIIPAKNESELIPKLLDSIKNQKNYNLQKCLTVLIFNSSKKDNLEVEIDNTKSIKYINDTKLNFEICYVDASSKYNYLPEKNAGVGLSRKIGADLALYYSHPKSIFCFTDADCLLSPNYLEKINLHYNNNDENFAIVEFKHQRSEDVNQDKAIRSYEQYLIKTAKDMKMAGSPYGYVSLGSCITCNATSYLKVGGMNRHKATEDFYFLQELTKHYGNVPEIKETLVYPSSRISSRVHLGTGYRIHQLINGKSSKDLYFSDDSFLILGDFINIIKESFGLSHLEILEKTAKVDKLNEFLLQNNFDKILNSLVVNVDYKKYISQFHRWFDGLKTIKFLKYFSSIKR